MYVSSTINIITRGTAGVRRDAIHGPLSVFPFVCQLLFTSRYRPI